ATGPKPWAASAPTPGGATAVPSTVPSIMSTTLAPAPRAIPQPPARAVPSFVRGAGSGAGTDAFPGSSAVAAGAAARTGTAATAGVAVAGAPLEWSMAAPRAAASPKLPLRGAIIFLSLMLLLGLAIRGFSEQGGAEYLYPFSQAAKDTWYR